MIENKYAGRSVVFVVHHGVHSYVQNAITEAVSSGHYVIYIGADTALGALANEFWSDDIESQEYQEFVKRYRHLSTNPEWFELLCFKRYFLVFSVVKATADLHYFWMIDSDVIVLGDLHNVENHLLLKGFCAGLSIPIQNKYDWFASPHVSFWTVDALEDFVIYLGSLYSEQLGRIIEKYEYHVFSGRAGGVCDMTALYLWQDGKDDIFNTARAHDEGFPVFDNNINLGGNYRKNEFSVLPFLSIKQVVRDGQKFYLRSRRTGEYSQVIVLHFQGVAKQYVDRFVKVRQITLSSFMDYISMRVLGETYRKSAAIINKVVNFFS